MGDIKRYKNAKIWIQKEEYEHIKSAINTENPRSKGMFLKDLKKLLKAEKEGRLRLIDGEHSIYDGISVSPSRSHTPGSQYVTVETLDGSVIVASDTCYLYYNNRRHVPIGSTEDYSENLKSIRNMHRKAASPFFIIPGHDPLVKRLFPEVSEGIFHITTKPE